MLRKPIFVLSLSLLFLPVLFAQPDSTSRPQIRFASVIEGFLKTDSTAPPPMNGILFIGSSIFRQWESVPADMAPLPVFNRAFGGSRTHEVLYYAGKIVLPYKPKFIVYYCGSNDINGGVPPLKIFENFKTFCDTVSAHLPSTKIFYVSVNKAPQKKSRWSGVDSVNNYAAKYCSTTPGRKFIDVNPALFDDKGEPRIELYQKDLLHFKKTSYAEFTKIIKPILLKAWEEEK